MFCSNCGEKLENDAKFCSKCGYKIESQKEDVEKNITAMNKIKSTISIIFYILGGIGAIWLSIRAIIIEWVFVSQSFINFINPLIHLKVLLVLLQDFDIYAVILCFIVGNKLSNTK